VSGIELDLSVNHVLELYNSTLIYNYCLFDRRFHMLALYLKEFNKTCFPDPTFRLNSYSVVLLLLAFLQKEDVLPNLQEGVPPKIITYQIQHRNTSNEGSISFKATTNVAFKNFKEAEHSRSGITIGELLIRFLHFYLFEYDH